MPQANAEMIRKMQIKAEILSEYSALADQFPPDSNRAREALFNSFFVDKFVDIYYQQELLLNMLGQGKVVQ
jgi:hypothetical protein